MTLPPDNPVIRAEMTRAMHADRPDAGPDWHALEPALRAQWARIPRAADRDTARASAAAHFRAVRGLPDAATVVGPAPIDTRSPAS